MRRDVIYLADQVEGLQARAERVLQRRTLQAAMSDTTKRLCAQLRQVLAELATETQQAVQDYQLHLARKPRRDQQFLVQLFEDEDYTITGLDNVAKALGMRTATLSQYLANGRGTYELWNKGRFDRFWAYTPAQLQALSPAEKLRRYYVGDLSGARQASITVSRLGHRA